MNALKKHWKALVVAGVLLGGAGAFAGWWFLIRVDPAFIEEQKKAKEETKKLDQALGDDSEDDFADLEKELQ